MRQLIVTEWISLDGIFDASSMHKWWQPFDSAGRQQYIQNTINNCGAMLYGRKTYEMLYPYWSSFAHNEQGVADMLNNCQKYLASTTLKKAPWKNTTIINGDLVAEVARLKQEDGGYILVQGSSSLLPPLMEAGLVDEIKYLVNPAIVAGGQRLFEKEVNCNMEFLGFEQFDKGVVLLRYRPVKK
jgi:dihydrofolate reductase